MNFLVTVQVTLWSRKRKGFSTPCLAPASLLRLLGSLLGLLGSLLLLGSSLLLLGGSLLLLRGSLLLLGGSLLLLGGSLLLGLGGLLGRSGLLGSLGEGLLGVRVELERLLDLDEGFLLNLTLERAVEEEGDLVLSGSKVGKDPPANGNPGGTSAVLQVSNSGKDRVLPREGSRQVATRNHFQLFLN